MGSLSLRPGDSLTVPRTALSVGFIRFVSSSNATQATGFRLFPRWDSPPTEHASLSLVALWSRYSCGALIELQQSTEAFLTLDATGMLREQRNRGRQEQLIAFALVSAFEMIMCNELSYCPAQGRFTEENQLR